MTGPDISKGLNSQVSAQECHRDGGNQVRSIAFFFPNEKKILRFISIQIFLYTKSNKIHFDELCLEVGDTKTNGMRNIIFVICEDDRIQQNWIYDQEVFSHWIN